MKPIELHEAALREAGEAYEWYGKRSPLAANRFSDELYRTFQKIAEHPERFPNYLGNARRLRLRRFPYLVVYVDEPNRAHVIAVAHAKRRPGYWIRRCP